MSEQPAASINCGCTAAGLPIGLQIVGRRHDDLGVLRMAHAWEAMRAPQRPWPAAKRKNRRRFADRCAGSGTALPLRAHFAPFEASGKALLRGSPLILLPLSRRMERKRNAPGLSEQELRREVAPTHSQKSPNGQNLSVQILIAIG